MYNTVPLFLIFLYIIAKNSDIFFSVGLVLFISLAFGVLFFKIPSCWFVSFDKHFDIPSCLCDMICFFSVGEISYDKHSCVFWYSFLSVQYHLIFLPIIVVLFNIPSCRCDIISYSFLSVCYSLIFLHVGALSLISFPRFAILWNSFLSVCFF